VTFLVRVGTGGPTTIQIMYRIGGGGRLTEVELPGASRLRGVQAVRGGNAASEQFRLDLYGEVVGVMFIGAEMPGSKVIAWVVFDRAVRLAEQYIRRGTSSLHAVLR
jgi:hypothetical protein